MSRRPSKSTHQREVTPNDDDDQSYVPSTSACYDDIDLEKKYDDYLSETDDEDDLIDDINSPGED